MAERRRISIDRGEPLSATQKGRLCPRCGRATNACECRPAAARHALHAASGAHAAGKPPADGIVRVSRETKGRKGKGVTLVTGLRLHAAGLDALCKDLKQRCGAGGTAKDGVIEIQGDHRDALVAELESRGFTVKRGG